MSAVWEQLIGCSFLLKRNSSGRPPLLASIILIFKVMNFSYTIIPYGGICSSGAQLTKEQCVPILEEKLALVDLGKAGMSPIFYYFKGLSRIILTKCDFLAFKSSKLFLLPNFHLRSKFTHFTHIHLEKPVDFYDSQEQTSQENL